MSMHVKIDGFDELLLEASVIAAKLLEINTDIYISQSCQQNLHEKRLYEIARGWASKIFRHSNSQVIITGSSSKSRYESDWHCDYNEMTAIVSIVGPGTEFLQNDEICSFDTHQTLLFYGEEIETPLWHRAPLCSGHRLIFQARI